MHLNKATSINLFSFPVFLILYLLTTLPLLAQQVRQIEILNSDRMEYDETLGSNAIKYIGENNPAPLIEIGHKDEIENFLFYIKDNGIGIPQEYHQQIFGLFRGANQSEPEDNSTGVGLAIVKRIIESHKGKIWIDSEPGSGSTFFFTIPKKKSE